MKLFLKPTILFLFLFLATSCSDNSDDSCTPITCLNGGIQTTDCGCDCPEGFSNLDCSFKLTPISVTITKIDIKKFPDTNNGDWWDNLPINSDADIYFTIENPSSSEIYNGLDEIGYYEDASGLGGIIYPFILSPPLTITNVTGYHPLILYDYDTLLSDEFVSLLLFKPYNESLSGFPSTYTVNNPNNTFECDVTVVYTW